MALMIFFSLYEKVFGGSRACKSPLFLGTALLAGGDHSMIGESLCCFIWMMTDIMIYDLQNQIIQ